MNKIKKTLFALVVVMLVCIITLSLFVAIKGKSIAVSVIEKVLNRKVALESIRFLPPFSVAVDNLDIENLIKAKQIVISPSWLGFMSGRIVLNEVKLIKPEFFVIRQEDGTWNLPISKEKSNIIPAGIIIDNGILNFIDKKIDPAGFGFKVTDIYLKAHASVLSFKPLNVVFDLKSNIASGQSAPAATLNANGWVDLLRKNMKGRVALSDLDAVYFLPYYKNLVSSSFEKGRLYFTSDLNAQNNDLTADCHLKVKDVVFKQKEGKEKDFTISVLDIFTGGKSESGDNKEINLDFMIKTKLDNPRVDWARVTGSVVAKSLTDQMMNNPEETINKVKSIGKDFESLGKSILKEKAGDIFGTTENQEAAQNQEIQQNIEVPQGQ